MNKVAIGASLLLAFGIGYAIASRNKIPEGIVVDYINKKNRTFDVFVNYGGQVSYADEAKWDQIHILTPINDNGKYSFGIDYEGNKTYITIKERLTGKVIQEKVIDWDKV